MYLVYTFVIEGDAVAGMCYEAQLSHLGEETFQCILMTGMSEAVSQFIG